jgi:hypothetical protein
VVIEALTEAVDGIAKTEFRGLGTKLGEVLVAMRHEIDRLEAEFARGLRDFDELKE